jgi:hypothetical protein
MSVSLAMESVEAPERALKLVTIVVEEAKAAAAEFSGPKARSPACPRGPRMSYMKSSPVNFVENARPMWYPRPTFSRSNSTRRAG